MIHGFEFNTENGMYEYDSKKNYCFNNTNLTPMGVVFW